MSIKSIALYSFLMLTSLVAAADDMKNCPSTQLDKCNNFCSSHQGVQSCMVNMATRSGSCTCTDGASHSK